MSERTMEGQGRAEQMRAMLAVGGSLSRSIAAMQAAWIEWRHGRGADAAMQWIENTLIGPGLIPGDDESDAQAFFDRAIAEIEEHRRGVEAEIAAIAAPEPGGEGGTLESRAYEVAHWIATEARVAESLGRSVAPIESEGARRIVALASARPTPADVREQAAADAAEIWYHWIEGQEDLAIAALRKASDEELARFLDMLTRWQKCPKPSDHDAPNGDLRTWWRGWIKTTAETAAEIEGADPDAIADDVPRMVEQAAAIVREAMEDAAGAERRGTWEQHGAGHYADRILALLRTPRGEAPAHVYVVTANDDERVAEQKVFANYNDARREYLRLVDLYGGSAVCLASRYVRRALAALRSEAQGEPQGDWGCPEIDSGTLASGITALERRINESDALGHPADEYRAVLAAAREYQRICAALEAQGEGWQVTEPARDIVRREMPETRATVREAIRAARRGKGGGE